MLPLKRGALSSLVLACYTLLMSLVAPVCLALDKADLIGRRGSRVILFGLLAPAVLAGVLQGRLTGSKPSSGRTWWMALCFTLTNFALGTVLWGPSLLLHPSPGLVPLQHWGILAAVFATSICISAVAFRLGSSRHDRPTLLRMFHLNGGNKSPTAEPERKS